MIDDGGIPNPRREALARRIELRMALELQRVRAAELAQEERADQDTGSPDDDHRSITKKETQ